MSGVWIPADTLSDLRTQVVGALAEVTQAQQERNEARRDLALERDKVMRLETDLSMEQLQRVSAQNGLVPYVRSLEAFDGWLRQRPTLRAKLTAILQELGLWEIKLGYDPQEDINTSLASAKRSNRVLYRTPTEPKARFTDPQLRVLAAARQKGGRRL